MFHSTTLHDMSLHDYKLKFLRGQLNQVTLIVLQNLGERQQHINTYIRDYNRLCQNLAQRCRDSVLNDNEVLCKMCMFYNSIRRGCKVKLGRDMRLVSEAIKRLPYSREYQLSQQRRGRDSPDTVMDTRLLLPA